LLTNLVDPRRFPRTAIIALYWQRWAVETHYRDEKTLQHIEQFHSRTPDGIRQELFAILIGCVIARTLTALAVPSESIETAQSGVPGVVARKCTVRRIPRITLSWFVIQFY
jgi:hypothetical protein